MWHRVKAISYKFFVRSKSLVILMSILRALQITKKSKEKEENAYLKTGSVATEVLSSIRTVFAFGGEYKEEKRLFDIICIHQVTIPENVLGQSFFTQIWKTCERSWGGSNKRRLLFQFVSRNRHLFCTGSIWNSILVRKFSVLWGEYEPSGGSLLLVLLFTYLLLPCTLFPQVWQCAPCQLWDWRRRQYNSKYIHVYFHKLACVNRNDNMKNSLNWSAA